MKSVAVLLLIALVTFGLVGAAVAQTTGSSPSGSASGSVSTPSGSASGSVSSPVPKPAAPDRPAVKSDSKSGDDASALPRTVTSERTTIFGLSPTAAVIIAAALLVVVILAIVAMTRSNDTYIDTNRRI
jgi:hypothetical protein